MPHRISTWLEDIQTSINYIEQFLGSQRNFAEFRQNIMMKQAIERNLEIIGEATNRILKKNPDINISSAKSIVALRNLVIHTYDRIDDSYIWKIICKDLPLLKEEIDKLLEDYV